MESNTRTGWVLAFDASCARCREVSLAIDAASQGRLEVLPLSHEDVRSWRAEALGANAPWAPVLIRVEDGQVRAWTGVRMGLRLVGRLGPRYSIRVLRALGEMGAPAERPGGARIERRRLLSLGAGAGIAAGLILAGKAPALAAPDSAARAAARNWASAHPVPRPGVYDEFGRQGLATRRAIFAEVSPTMRSHLWTEQLARYRSARAGLTPEQARILDEAGRIVSDETVFRQPDAEVQEIVGALEAAAIEAFGRGEACQLLYTLGPVEAAAAEPRLAADAQPAATCNCRRNNSCDTDCLCVGCSTTWPGCGCFWVYTCNGLRCA